MFDSRFKNTNRIRCSMNDIDSLIDLKGRLQDEKTEYKKLNLIQKNFSSINLKPSTANV